MKLRIGNQTAHSAGSMFEPFEFALENGFDAFEFSRTGDPAAGAVGMSAGSAAMSGTTSGGPRRPAA